MSRRKRRREKRAAQIDSEITKSTELSAPPSQETAEVEVPKPPLWARSLTMLRDNRQIIQFGVTWAVLVLIGSSLLQWDPVVRGLVDPFTELIARLAGNLIKMFGTTVQIDGVILQGTGVAIQIMNNCNAIYEMFIFSAAVVAYPTAIKNKATGIILGLGIIYIINLVRVLGLFYIGTFMPNLFEGAHIYVAQIFFIVFVAMTWVYWIEQSA